MKKYSFTIKSSELMQEFGGILAKFCGHKCIIYLVGQLGAGKTTLVRGFLRALGYDGFVKSPTYTIVEPYAIDGEFIYHFDLYRLANAEELEYLGARDYFAEESICFIEWPEHGFGFLPKADLICKIDIVDNDMRIITLESGSAYFPS